MSMQMLNLSEADEEGAVLAASADEEDDTL
jgi:hypothetical protein